MKFPLMSALLIIVVMYIDDSGSLIVYNGEIVTGNQFKWVVRVYAKGEGTCTGSIISEFHILTAAHCVEKISKENVKITAGINWLHHSNNSSYKLRKISLHPSYGKEFMSVQVPDSDEESFAVNDIAVLTLEAALTFGENIGKISLPNRKPDFSKHPLCEAAGWGCDSTGVLSSHLLWTSVKMADKAIQLSAYCQTNYGILCGMSLRLNSYLSEGDSGAGLLCSGTLIGVHVAGHRDVDGPMLFESVFYHLSFIYGVIDEDEDTGITTSVRISTSRKSKQPTCICM